MLNLRRFLPRRWMAAPASERKHSAAAPLIAIDSGRQPQWMARSVQAFAGEGFAGNAVGYRCVRMIAEAAASVPWLLYEGEREHQDHPLLALLGRPNPAEDGQSFAETLYGHLLVTGNAYVEAVCLEERPRELYVLRSDRMKLIPGRNGWPEAFDYAVGGSTIRFRQDVKSGLSPILHLKLYNPSCDYYGLSPFAAAARAIDILNQSDSWNKALLDNSARPSGALLYRTTDGGGNLTEDQFMRLKQELDVSYQSAANAGRPLVLEGGLDWKEMGYSPKDMDYIEGKREAARDVALAFGVPPMLLGIPGDNTYANYAEANRTFWRQSVLPLLARTSRALTHWLRPAFGENLRLSFDADAIEALSVEREALWLRLERASFLTADEKRAAIGYEPLPRQNNQQNSLWPGEDPAITTCKNLECVITGLDPVISFDPQRDGRIKSGHDDLLNG
jgi:HK97 family phage portal protein